MSKIRFVNTVKQPFFQNNFHLSQKYVSMCTVYMHIFPHFEPEVKYSAHLVYFSLFYHMVPSTHSSIFYF